MVTFESFRKYNSQILTPSQRQNVPEVFLAQTPQNWGQENPGYRKAALSGLLCGALCHDVVSRQDGEHEIAGLMRCQDMGLMRSQLQGWLQSPTG